MKKALLVIDVQNAIVNAGDFNRELSLMERIINDFEANGDPVIFIQHTDDIEESPLYEKSTGSDLHNSLKEYASLVITKQTPSSFYKTNLAETLNEHDIEHLFITGFNTEFCCMFTGIAAYDRGYKVTFIEDATGTVNNEEVYEMKGLDIKDFVGTVLDWSSVIEVLYFEEYEEIYRH